jgi:hypothetical protein
LGGGHAMEVTLAIPHGLTVRVEKNGRRAAAGRSSMVASIQERLKASRPSMSDGPCLDRSAGDRLTSARPSTDRAGEAVRHP